MPRINHNVSAMITGFALNQVDLKLSSSLEKLSTGLRINRSADDAAGLSISEQLTGQVNGLDQGARNIQDGTNLLNIADGALNEVEAMLQRMRELAVQSANDTNTATERNYIQIEVTQLTSEVDREVNGAQFNTEYLLNGTAPWGTPPGGVLHIGPNNIPGTDEIQFNIPSVTSTALGIDAAVMNVTSQTDSTAAITSLDAALNSVNEVRANIGALVNRLQSGLTNQQNMEQNMQAAESTISDVDFASETTKYTTESILSQSSTAMLAQANQVPKQVLNLLQNL